MKSWTKWLLAGMLFIAAISAIQAQESKIAVLNPKGSPPPVPLLPMAQRPANLDSKTIYFIDIKYEGGASLLRAVMEQFGKSVPSANLVFREKAGLFDQDDKKLWSEIKAKADAVVLAVGH